MDQQCSLSLFTVITQRDKLHSLTTHSHTRNWIFMVDFPPSEISISVDRTGINQLVLMLYTWFVSRHLVAGNVRWLTGDAPCEQYSGGTCDVTSGHRCVRFNDVTERDDGASVVQCLCTLGVGRCGSTATLDNAGLTSSLTDDDVTDDVKDDVETQFQRLTHRHTDRLVGRHRATTFVINHVVDHCVWFTLSFISLFITVADVEMNEYYVYNCVYFVFFVFVCFYNPAFWLQYSKLN